MAALTTGRASITLGGSAAVLLASSLYMSLSTPAEETQGEAAKLLFVHVPSAITAYIALGVGLLAAVWYLIRRSPSADLLSASAIEIGVLFTGLTLLTGMIWGRHVWGLWWDWGDARMMSTAVLFFFYVGYLALRRAITDPRVRAARCAILGVIAFVQVPIVHYSVLWFRTLHQGPTIIRPDVANATMDEAFGRPLVVSIVGFALLLAFLLTTRFRLARVEAEVADLSLRDSPVGGAVAPPRLGREDG
ncbi:MAG: cytochrome c biogenesis protein CcsA [bacterium]|nr:cytochrome c biogenesis protein CcsA [bacterium]MDE0290605.1 cytochrome c biogenesis protein CcsA [bacterium]MDE0439943.1 cytochrome c biogenesis protein CcsA [bacterium]